MPPRASTGWSASIQEEDFLNYGCCRDMKRIHILPLGEVVPDTLHAVARGLRETFQYETVVGEPAPKPEKTYSTRRKQFNST